MGTYDGQDGLTLTLAGLKDLMQKAGVRKLYCKRLAPNDNSKNQPYLGPDLTAINIIPSGPTTAEITKSNKIGAAGELIFKAPLKMYWLSPSGEQLLAPDAKIILYPQYPETRFSGFLNNSKVKLSEWMDPAKRGRSVGRCLFLGVADDNKILSFLSVPDSQLSNEISEIHSSLEREGIFFDIPFSGEADSKSQLLTRLQEISGRGWIQGVRLQNGMRVACNSPHCGGYTLETLLGISPNGYSEPDFLGWEVKQYNVPNFRRLHSSIITLMTPEPNGGIYKANGVGNFIRRYGYPDRKGRPDRINFGGVHRYSDKNALTGLKLELLGFDEQSNRITDLNGGVALIDESGNAAAIWGFAKLIDHWKKKHNKAVYIPSLSLVGATRSYKYGNVIKLCEGTDFLNVIASIRKKSIYYDPGLKIENASTAPRIKCRSQFRIKSGDIDTLYDRVENLDLKLLK